MWFQANKSQGVPRTGVHYFSQHWICHMYNQTEEDESGKAKSLYRSLAFPSGQNIKVHLLHTEDIYIYVFINI